MKMNVPLDKQHVITEAGPSKKKETVPALHPRWVETVQFVSYQPPPVDLTDRGQYEEWCERLKFIEDDLHWLLQLRHDKFWCQAVFDETLHKLVDTYLRYAPRDYEAIKELPSEAKERHDQIHQLIFMTCLRMATYKESKEYHITPNVFGEILYENFIFDIPKLFDLCILYHQGNRPLLSKMIENIFTQQPKYNDDLVQTIHTLSQVFDNITNKCGINTDSGSLSPQKLDSQRREATSLVTMAAAEFKDIVLYLADVGLTLKSFLEVYPPACQDFHHNEFLPRLASFYESVIPEVLSTLKLKELPDSEKSAIKQQVTRAKKCFLSVCQNILTYCCITPLLEKRGVATDYVEDYLGVVSAILGERRGVATDYVEDYLGVVSAILGERRGVATDYVEDYLGVVSAILGERRFLADYESLFSFHGDIEVLLQASSGVDETRIHYIEEAVNQAFATYGKRKAPKGAMKRGGRRSPDGSPGPADGGGAMAGAVGGALDMNQSDDYHHEAYDLAGACAPRVTGVELDSLVSSVKDLLPDLGEGFIELCLEEYNYEIEKVINAVLEDKLPPSLIDLDRTMKREKRISPPPTLVAEREKRISPPPTLVAERKNIFDYDEFDVFHRDDIKTDNIRKGKSGRTDDIVLGDRTAIRDIKENISKDYGLVADVEEVEESYVRDMYEDEYDDTYDTNVVGADDADSADELTNRRPFIVPRVLGGGQKKEEKGSTESEESDEEGPPRDQFVQDPTVLRERAAQRAQAMRSRGRGQGHRHHDVKGVARGQGQSAEVMRNRRWKEQHKGGNRRVLADKKRL